MLLKTLILKKKKIKKKLRNEARWVEAAKKKSTKSQIFV